MNTITVEQKVALKEWLVGYRWDYLVTIHPGTKMDKNVLSNVLARLIARINHLNFGKRSIRQLNWFPVLEESPDGWLHVHLLVGGPLVGLDKDSLKQQVRSVWIDTKGAGKMPYEKLFNEEWFKPVYGLEGAVEYMTKTMRFDPELMDWHNVNRFHKQ